MIVTNDQRLAETVRSLRNQGRSADDNFVFDRLGYNYRLSDIQAVLGIEQLKRVDSFLKARQQVAEWYADELGKMSEIILPPGIGDKTVSWFIFLIQFSAKKIFENRDQIRKKLAQDGIETAKYFPCIHLQKFYREMFGYHEGDFPVAELVSKRTLALPFHNRLERAEVKYVCQKLALAISELGA